MFVSVALKILRPPLTSNSDKELCDQKKPCPLTRKVEIFKNIDNIKATGTDIIGPILPIS